MELAHILVILVLVPACLVSASEISKHPDGYLQIISDATQTTKIIGKGLHVLGDVTIDGTLNGAAVGSGGGGGDSSSIVSGPKTVSMGLGKDLTSIEELVTYLHGHMFIGGKGEIAIKIEPGTYPLPADGVNFENLNPNTKIEIECNMLSADSVCIFDASSVTTFNYQYLFERTTGIDFKGITFQAGSQSTTQRFAELVEMSNVDFEDCIFRDYGTLFKVESSNLILENADVHNVQSVFITQRTNYIQIFQGTFRGRAGSPGVFMSGMHTSTHVDALSINVQDYLTVFVFQYAGFLNLNAGLLKLQDGQTGVHVHGGARAIVATAWEVTGTVLKKVLVGPGSYVQAHGGDCVTNAAHYVQETGGNLLCT
eukprot:Nk52_evm62s151 gene=Nk52_evmTU62s151